MLPLLQHATAAFQPLREAVESSLLELESSKTKQVLQRTSSRAALEAKLDSMFNDSQARLLKHLERTKSQIKSYIPENDEERRDWETHVFPHVEGTLKATEGFIAKLFESIVNFFLGLWSAIENAIAWATEKIGEFVGQMIVGFRSIFDKD